MSFLFQNTTMGMRYGRAGMHLVGTAWKLGREETLSVS